MQKWQREGKADLVMLTKKQNKKETPREGDTLLQVMLPMTSILHNTPSPNSTLTVNPSMIINSVVIAPP